MAVFYFIFRAFAWITAQLPMGLLYFVSGFLRVLLEHIFRYRRKTIIGNLESSFPEKSPEEIRKIVKQFYRNLGDIIVEVMKLQGITKAQLLNRFSFTGKEIMEDSFSKGRSVIVAIGHCGNWEWMGTALGLIFPVKGYAIIKPLSSKYFYHYMEMLRHRLNPDSTIPFRHTFRIMARNRKEFISFNVIASDQTPLRGEINYWHPFLNQDTAFFQGVEKLSRSLDFDVVFIDIRRTGRGKYVGDIQLITNDPMNTEPGEITEKYIQSLENAIRSHPDNWLWSHRRWKHKKPD